MRKYALLFVAALMSASLAPAASAESAMGRGGQGAPNVGAAFAKIFGNNTSFTATADMTMTGGRAGPHSMEMKYAVRDGQVRIDIDMSKMQGGRMPPERMEQMKKMGMDKVTTIVHPGKDTTTYMVYPGMQSYVEMHPPGGEASAPPKISKHKIGHETIDGHPCDKYTVTITGASGKSREMTSWEASDMGNFPIQNQVTERNMVTTINFKDISRAKPAASLFDVPQGYTKYDSMRAMMMAHMGAFMGMMHHGQ